MSWKSTGLALLVGCLCTWVSRADDWPQWLGPQRDGVWREQGVLKKFPEGGPKVLWREPLGTGYSGPAVAAGRVYVMDRQRGEGAASKPAAGEKPRLPGKERVLCLDAKSGKEIWKHEYDCPYIGIAHPTGPRTTPTVHQGKVYTLGTMGDLLCLDAKSGKVVWSKQLSKQYKAEPPVWGWSSPLLIEGDKVISLVGGEGSAVVAFNKDTGNEAWKALTSEEVGYAPPVVFEYAGKRQLIIWVSEAINSLDPETGKVYWTALHPSDGNVKRPAVPITTPRLLGDYLFVSTAYHGPLMLKLTSDKPGAVVVWRGTSDDPGKPDRLHNVMASPVLKEGHVYGVCSMGQMRCIKMTDGAQVWETLKPTTGKPIFMASAFVVEHGDRYFLFNDKGELIIARMTPKGYEEISRAKILDPALFVRGRDIVWCQPAFANRCMVVRNEKEIVCISLAET